MSVLCSLKNSLCENNSIHTHLLSIAFQLILNNLFLNVCRQHIEEIFDVRQNVCEI